MADFNKRKIPIEKNDKFQLNIDVAWDANLESANSLFNYQIAQILLYADDGTYYTLFRGTMKAIGLTGNLAHRFQYISKKKFTSRLTALKTRPNG